MGPIFWGSIKLDSHAAGNFWMDFSYNRALFGVGTTMALDVADFAPPKISSRFFWWHFLPKGSNEPVIRWSYEGQYLDTVDGRIIWDPFGGEIKQYKSMVIFKDFPYYNELIWVGNFSWPLYCQCLHFAIFAAHQSRLTEHQSVEFEDEDSTHDDTLESIYKVATQEMSEIQDWSLLDFKELW